ncbi:unnamed protein product [Paramecium pentaurelia]|uniref:Uncharacterized protein n=1 Tax=Paramecium pentaurelia TaxID=43138 RepID=A0A8S1UC17_9CILI|nr:unnamed protein product [Paramecium pentaurelia]
MLVETPTQYQIFQLFSCICYFRKFFQFLNQLNLFEFIQGILKQVLIFSEHGREVSTFNFMKRSDHFISGSTDSSMIIWPSNQNGLRICQQKLNERTSNIVCLLLNNNEDIIISGSNDYKIKFWQKQNEWFCYQTITDHTSTVLGLSFNEQSNKFIFCGYGSSILVFEQSELNKQWIVIQKITVKDFGFRLCFIDNKTFTFYPYGKDYIEVFEMNNSNKQYTKTKDIPNGSNISFIRKKQDGKFMIEESIEFGTRSIFGYMTDDGQYLITWDENSKEIQIRKYQEK